MDPEITPNPAQQQLRSIIEIALRLGLLLVLLLWGLQIILPFVDMLAWAAIIAIALYPLHLKLRTLLGNRKNLAATLLTLSAIAILVVPVVQVTIASVDSSRELAEQWREGTLHVPRPSEKVKEWPLIGNKVYAGWMDASQNLKATIVKFEPELKELGGKLLGIVASTGGTILKFVFSFIVAGVLMATADATSNFTGRLGRRLLGEQGQDYASLIVKTIRSVAQGVLGIAIIQSLAAAVALVIMDVPLAALWAAAVLIFAIVQLPTILVLGPLMVWSFSAYDTTAATIFTVWLLFVGFLDNILKPLLLGRGVEIPMLVILIGAIGGMIASGIIGLFVGAVVLALIYRLFIAWMNTASTGSDTPAAASGNA